MIKRMVVGLGEVLWDVYPDQALFGGAPANFACHAGSLGADTRIVSAVGRDPLGGKALEWMTDHGQSIDYVAVDPNHPTGSVAVALDAKGSPEYHFAPEVAWDYLKLQPHWSELARRCDAVCYGTLAQRSSLSSSSIMEFLDQTSKDALRVFDVNLRQDFYSSQVLSCSMQRANVLKLNHEELPIVADLLKIPSGTDQHVCEQLAQRYRLRAVALTKGAQGSAVYLDGCWDQQVAGKVDAIDTVGAGDAFSAALITGILDKKPLAQIHRRAAEIAAYVCTQRGAVVPLPESLLK